MARFLLILLAATLTISVLLIIFLSSQLPAQEFRKATPRDLKKVRAIQPHGWDYQVSNDSTSCSTVVWTDTLKKITFVPFTNGEYYKTEEILPSKYKNFTKTDHERFKLLFPSAIEFSVIENFLPTIEVQLDTVRSIQIRPLAKGGYKIVQNSWIGKVEKEYCLFPLWLQVGSVFR